MSSSSTSSGSVHNTSETLKTEVVVKMEPEDHQDTQAEVEQSQVPVASEPMFTPSPRKIKREPKTPKDSPIRGLPFSPSQVQDCLIFSLRANSKL